PRSENSGVGWLAIPFTTSLISDSLGFPINAIIRIAASAERGTSLLKTFRETPNVVEVMRVTGSDSYILHVLTRSSAELEAVIDRIGSFGTITTSLVLSIPIPAAERVSLALGAK
ncbi:Lrp/AsnC family transcriptional regulator, partial [Ralstonia solanacearum]|uniref:Lrp/AsnC family transcriptional regulator n=1 Tax=Ralstonia solanacearum TaxID=305 RepID=UPI00202A5B1D